MSRSSSLILIISIAAGVGLGLYLGWVVSPVQYVDTDPASLAQNYKDDAVLMMATRYSGDGNVEAAQSSLARLGFADAGSAVAATTERLIAAGQPEADLRRLAKLAVALGHVTPAMQSYLP